MRELRKVQRIEIIPLGEHGKFGNLANEVTKAFGIFISPIELHRMRVVLPTKDGKEEHLEFVISQGELHVEMASP